MNNDPPLGPGRPDHGTEAWACCRCDFSWRSGAGGQASNRRGAARRSLPAPPIGVEDSGAGGGGDLAAAARYYLMIQPVEGCFNAKCG
ncbi:hypothetical protein BS78_01G051400 [Paspalum vaginatum]|nr:hypothetical protein BS78_01G051400 [Paspalum vaginatum]